MRTSVLVVGGGVVGLTSALFLAKHGVACTLVERHPDLLIHPRSRGLSPRTMEVYRQASLEKPILDAAYGGAGFRWTPVQANTLSDDDYVSPNEPHEDDGSAASPCSFGPIDQDKLEILVRDRARELGADLRFHTELTSFAQDNDGVTGAIRHRGNSTTDTVRADYLIAADGFPSPIRHSLGIEVDGPGPLFTTMTAIVDADLNAALRGRRATIAYLQQPRPYTTLMAHDNAGRRWVFGTGYDPKRESLEDYTDERVADMVRAAAGISDVRVTLRPQVPGTDLKVLGFPIGAHVARSYSSGRVFLVGDAAHVWPPTGGLGANAGIQDAHNLAWKLAMVINQSAGPALLDTYESERRPTGQLTMGQAMARFGARMASGDGPEMIDYGAVSMGYRYASAPGHDLMPLPPRELAGQPGTRAPHVSITLSGRPMSTLDLYGSRLILLAGSAGESWVAAAGKLDVAVDAYVFGADVCSGYGIGDDGASLIRPDGFVAWRSTSGAADPVHTLTGVTRSILFRRGGNNTAQGTSWRSIS